MNLKKLKDFFRNILFTESKAITVDAAEKIVREYKLSSIDVIERAEVLLNQFYRFILLNEQSAHSASFEKYRQGFSPSEIARRRQLLSEVKQIVGKGRVPLMLNLIVESLGLRKRRN